MSASFRHHSIGNLSASYNYNFIMSLGGFEIQAQQAFTSTNVEEVMRFCIQELGSTLTITMLCGVSFETSYLSIKDKDITTGVTTEVAIPRSVICKFFDQLALSVDTHSRGHFVRPLDLGGNVHISAVVKMRGEAAHPSLAVVNKNKEHLGLSTIHLSQFMARCLISSARELMYCVDHTIEAEKSDEHFHFYGIRAPNSSITLDYFTSLEQLFEVFELMRPGLDAVEEEEEEEEEEDEGVCDISADSSDSSDQEMVEDDDRPETPPVIIEGDLYVEGHYYLEDELPLALEQRGTGRKYVIAEHVDMLPKESDVCHFMMTMILVLQFSQQNQHGVSRWRAALVTEDLYRDLDNLRFMFNRTLKKGGFTFDRISHSAMLDLLCGKSVDHPVTVAKKRLVTSYCLSKKEHKRERVLRAFFNIEVASKFPREINLM